MARAFREMFGIESAFATVEFAGRTDRYIFCEALRQHGIQGEAPLLLKEFTSRYQGLLGDALQQKQGRLMPGFPQLLDSLSRHSHLRLGLATGNFAETGRMKLAHYKLDHFFPATFGAFGAGSEDRNEIVREAIATIRNGDTDSDVWIIGDTPYDVASALASDSTAVGVATGYHKIEELEAAGAHFVFPDFSDWQGVARLLAGT